MKKIWIYLGITFGLTWLLWGVAFYTPLSQTIETSGISIVFISAGMFCPLIGALLTKRIMKKQEHIDLKMRPHIKGNVRFYLLGWFVPAIITVLGALVFFLVFPSHFDASFSFLKESLAPLVAAGQISENLLPVILVVQIVGAITLAPFVNMIFAFGEETGWRGFLFPSLCEHMSQRKAVLVSGVIWGLWHAPVTCIGHNYGTDYWGFPFLGILCMCVFCLSLASCLSYLTVKVKSVWPAALAHGAINAVAGLGLLFAIAVTGMFPLLGPAPSGLIGGIPLMALGVFCWLKLSKERPELA